MDQLEVSQVTHSDKRLKNKMIDAKFYTITIELMLIMTINSVVFVHYLIEWEEISKEVMK